MFTLNLGVLDVAYSDARNGNRQTTTFEVATKLEERYHIMRTFYESRKDKISEFIADDIAASIQKMVGDRRISASKSFSFRNKFHGIATSFEKSSLTFGADQRIENEFRTFIFSNEMQKTMLALTGKPISAAALRGVNHRKKKPYAKKNKERPFAVDTGLFVSSFRAWTQGGP